MYEEEAFENRFPCDALEDVQIGLGFVVINTTTIK